MRFEAKFPNGEIEPDPGRTGSWIFPVERLGAIRTTIGGEESGPPGADPRLAGLDQPYRKAKAAPVLTDIEDIQP